MDVERYVGKEDGKCRCVRDKRKHKQIPSFFLVPLNCLSAFSFSLFPLTLSSLPLLVPFPALLVPLDPLLSPSLFPSLPSLFPLTLSSLSLLVPFPALLVPLDPLLSPSPTLSSSLLQSSLFPSPFLPCRFNARVGCD